MTENQVTPQRPPVSNAIGVAVVLSVIFGAVSGGVVSYSLFATNAGKSLVNQAADQARTVKVEEESASVDVVTRTSPAVVSIVATKDYSKIYGNQPISPFDRFFGWTLPQGEQEVSSGSGFIVKDNGWIVTNKHVVSDEQAQYTVVMNDGKKYDAKVMAKDPVNDVAIVKIEASKLPVLTLGDSDAVKIGQTVIAIGNALGQYRNTVTKGVISGKARTITAGDSSGSSETLSDVFQTDASINPGNSGGPLIDLDGNVIAMNTAVDQQGQLIGFAIPVNVVKKDLASVERSGKIIQPYLGVRYVEVTKTMADQNKLPVDYGALISAGSGGDEPAVISGSPADKAGLKENDIIVAVGADEVRGDTPLINLLAKHSPGEKVVLKIYHQGEKKDVAVTLEERKDS